MAQENPESTRVEKRDKMIRAKRLIAVEKAMALGMSHYEIQERIANQYDVTERTVRKDIVVVETQWGEQAEQEKPLRRHQTRCILRKIVQRAMERHQYGPAVQAVRRLMELDGLTDPSVILQLNQTTNVNGGQETRTLTTAERNNRIEVLIAERARLKGLNGHGGGNGVDRAGAIPARCSEGDEESGGGDE